MGHLHTRRWKFRVGVMSTLESNAAVLQSINHSVGCQQQLLQRLLLLLLLLESRLKLLPRVVWSLLRSCVPRLVQVC